MLSRIAAPKLSGPPDASWPSSNTITILSTTVVAKIGGKAAASCRGPHRRRTQPVLVPATVGGSAVVLSSDRSTFSALPPDAAPETRPAVAATSSVTNGTFFSRFLTSATSLYGLSYLLVCLGRLASPPCGRCAQVLGTRIA